ncbi:excisionase family DNA-binding protein [Ruegeria arenilitoris]|uniref:excisionase family DNA-binding protein n=1 Tax=Ruegeria arenilitoris TaxID=1173585 RepID=UPI000BB454CB
MTRPYTPESLAKRWDCSAETVRQLCKSGRLSSFRIGRLFRIPSQAVEEFEQCRNTQSAASKVASSLSGMRKVEKDAGIVVMRKPVRQLKQKRGISSSPQQPRKAS